MINNLLQKILAPTAVGTVIGFSSILGTISSASALTINSPSVNREGKTQDISNIVLYLKDNSGTISKVKIDSVSGTKSYDTTNFLNKYYQGSEVVAYTVKSGDNKSDMGPGEGELFVLNQQSNLPKGAANDTYKYSEVSQIQPSPQAPAPTPIVEEPAPTPIVQEPDIQPGRNTYALAQEPPTEKVKVPEPGSIAAIAIFGIGGLLAKKKVSS
ncbi:PEP-CTERM sorting domain-containing protein [Plectonema cf. radiosum LEGE 06105]|uniref:PEP-CTERM sorting domain-containing protein n=1 Tax=Plectonema cf. radiosum LEGE 06105 TaxID=945769 RepID=A0A8J7F567_9CYAN|nr:PEP-CTERM sorting domain-containing protein [Plectonema radiosum]MBE9211414.1 PEP-CTERM sorting domain-containing protein [Plectonema cf. radiosum LEGE 06105]